MKNKINLYTLAIGLLALMELQNAIGELIPLQEVIISYRKTLLPESLLGFLVVSKFLAALVLILPRFYQLKEWVFAGILIDILGAGLSYLLAGSFEAFGLYLVPPALLVWGFAYFQFQKHLKLVSYTLPAATDKKWKWTAYLFAFIMIVLGIAELTKSQPVVDSMVLLGFPIHSLYIIGGAKILGGIALLLPGMITIKHWAYAGFAFDFLGAVYLYLVGGHSALFDLSTLFILTLLLGYSYMLFSRQKNQI
ncbi:MAG: DoxX family protein [bacterium]